MGTNYSSPNSYCTPAQLLQRYDARRLGELLLDIGCKAEAEAIKNSGSTLPENSTIQFALDDASGQVEAVCFVGQRYSPADLQTLQGASKAFLAGLVADIAYWTLQCRRKADTEIPQKAQVAYKMLDALSEGKAIFGIQEVAEAGLPLEEVVNRQDIQNRNFATLQAQRFFGDRANWTRNRC